MTHKIDGDMHAERSNFRRSGLIGLLLLALGLGQCGAPAPKPQVAVRGVTDTEIVIGSWGPQTGPAALWGSVNRGMEAYFKMINDAGGIHGRKLRLEHRDDGYQPQRTAAIARELVEREQVFAIVGGVGTATGMAVRDYIVAQQVPWISPSSGSSHWAYPPERNIFATYPLYCDEAAILIDYAVQDLGKDKIAFFFQDDDYGKGGLSGAKLALEAKGMSLVEKVSSQVSETDLTSQVLKLQASGAQVVVAWVLPKQAQILLATAARMGYQPQWMMPSTLSDPTMMYQLTRGAWEGVIFASFGLLEEHDPQLQAYRRAARTYAPKEQWGVFFASGFLIAEPLVEALRRSGRDLTYDKFITAMESLDGFSGSGAPLNFGPGQRQGRRAVRLYACEHDGKVLMLSDWKTSKINLEEAIELLGKPP